MKKISELMNLSLRKKFGCRLKLFSLLGMLVKSGSRRLPDQKRNDIEQLAIQFLLSMDSTLCFFTVSLRMIALAPWKDSMVAIDVRQAAVVAISKGWFVKSQPFNAYPLF